MLKEGQPISESYIDDVDLAHKAAENNEGSMKDNEENETPEVKVSETSDQLMGELRKTQTDIKRYLEVNGYSRGVKMLCDQLKHKTVEEVLRITQDKFTKIDLNESELPDLFKKYKDSYEDFSTSIETTESYSENFKTRADEFEVGHTQISSIAFVQENDLKLEDKFDGKFIQTSIKHAYNKKVDDWVEQSKEKAGIEVLEKDIEKLNPEAYEAKYNELKSDLNILNTTMQETAEFLADKFGDNGWMLKEIISYDPNVFKGLKGNKQKIAERYLSYLIDRDLKTYRKDFLGTQDYIYFEDRMNKYFAEAEQQLSNIKKHKTEELLSEGGNIVSVKDIQSFVKSAIQFLENIKSYEFSNEDSKFKEFLGKKDFPKEIIENVEIHDVQLLGSPRIELDDNTINKIRSDGQQKVESDVFDKVQEITKEQDEYKASIAAKVEFDWSSLKLEKFEAKNNISSIKSDLKEPMERQKTKEKLDSKIQELIQNPPEYNGVKLSSEERISLKVNRMFELDVLSESGQKLNPITLGLELKRKKVEAGQLETEKKFINDKKIVIKKAEKLKNKQIEIDIKNKESDLVQNDIYKTIAVGQVRKTAVSAKDFLNGGFPENGEYQLSTFLAELKSAVAVVGIEQVSASKQAIYEEYEALEAVKEAKQQVFENLN